MNNDVIRARLQQRNMKISKDMEKELKELDKDYAPVGREDAVWTIDTSSFLTLICC